MLNFADYPQFTPNLSPKEIFAMGSFGGTYWRPIYSSVQKKKLKNKHKLYTFLESIPAKYLTGVEYDKSINKYNVIVGTTLQFWESKNWISIHHPYGWVQWYCDFYMGKRCSDDERQIKRWIRTAGPNSRFRKWLINMILKKKTKYDDYDISPKIRQTLQHWGYQITAKDLS